MSIIVRTTPKNHISINTPKQTQIKTLAGSGGGAATRLRNLLDVDASDIDQNETLVYDEVSDKFVVKEIPIINAGEF